MAAKKRLVFVVSLLIVLFLAIVFQVLKLVHNVKEIKRVSMENSRNEGKRVGSFLDTEFSKIEAAALAFSNELVSGKIPGEKLPDRMKQTLNEFPEAFGFGIAYEPYAYKPDIKLFAPYFIRNGKDLEYRQIDKVYDYTSKEEQCKWYYETLERKINGWLEPHKGRVSGTLLAEYTIPLYSPADKTRSKPLGVLFINYSLESLKKTMLSLQLGKSGYGFIISRKGKFLAHPRQEYVSEQKTISDVLGDLKETEKRKIYKAIENLKNKEYGILEVKSETSGLTRIMFFQDIPSTGWSLVAVFLEHDIPVDRALLNHGIMWIIITSILFFGLLFSLIFRVFEGATPSLWKLSVVVSLLICIGIFVIWNLDYDSQNSNDVKRVKLFDKTTLSDYLHENTSGNRISIPTGVFIQSLEFTSANNVTLTGYVWQKYRDDIPAEIERGIFFPESVDGSIDEAYQNKNETGVTIGWNFKTTLRQPFDYSRYPLDQKDVWLRIWPKTINRNVTLVPDFDSYEMMNPGSLPGIEKDIVLSGLNLRESYFSFVPRRFDTSFGIEKYDGQTFPELYFTVMVDRNIIDPFISFLLPAIVVAGIIFSLFLIITEVKERVEKFAYNCAFILGAAAGLFFSVIIAHSQLRNFIQVNEIVYLEYFYIILYLMILLLAVNSFLFSLGSRFKFISFRDNLIPKVLYWPFVLTVLFLITVKTFY